MSRPPRPGRQRGSLTLRGTIVVIAVLTFAGLYGLKTLLESELDVELPAGGPGEWAGRPSVEMEAAQQALREAAEVNARRAREKSFEHMTAEDEAHERELRDEAERRRLEEQQARQRDRIERELRGQ